LAPSQTAVSMTKAKDWPGRGRLTSSRRTVRPRPRPRLRPAAGRPPAPGRPAPRAVSGSIRKPRFLLEPPAEGVDAVAQAVGQDAQPRSGVDLAGLLDGMHPELDVLVEDRGVAEVLEIGRRRLPGSTRPRVADPVEREALQDPGQAQALVAVEVGEQDPGDGRGRDAGQKHLALGPLPRSNSSPSVSQRRK